MTRKKIYQTPIKLDDRVEYFVSNVLHRKDGPAVIFNNGDTKWYKWGDIHRLNGPAIIYGSTHYWYKNNQLHREDGPAIIYKDCTRVWYIKNKMHRLYGPAICMNGYEKWYKNGILWGNKDFFEYGREIAITLAPFQLPAYVVLWILEWVCPQIAKLNQLKLIEMFQRIRDYHHSRKKLTIKQ